MSSLNNSGFILKPEMYVQEQWCEMYIKAVEEYQGLKKENERLIKKLMSYNMSGEVPYLNYEKIVEDYKSKNEKAIEITNKIIDAGYDTNEVLTLAIKQLDILQGSEE